MVSEGYIKRMNDYVIKLGIELPFCLKSQLKIHLEMVNILIEDGYISSYQTVIITSYLDVVNSPEATL